jgi:ppGpp synthetase/RelA/SpoT-type nucleotidyltranferase
MEHKCGIRLLLGFFGISLLTTHFSFYDSIAQAVLKSDGKVGDHSIAEYEALNPAEQTKFVERYRQKYSSAWSQALDALRASHSDPPFRVMGRLKSVQSIQEKIIRKKYHCFAELTDIAGTRLIIPNYAALPLVTKNIERQFLIREKQDLLRDEGRTGYRAIHYLAWVNGRIVEIQIHTQRSTLWAEASHQLVYKGPFSDNHAVVSYLFRLSEVIFLLDSGVSNKSRCPVFIANGLSGCVNQRSMYLLLFAQRWPKLLIAFCLESNY